MAGVESGHRGYRALVFDIPTLETERLMLREFREADFEGMATFFADQVSEFYGGPCGRDDAWRKFAAYSGHWNLRGYGPWALECKATGQYIGLCGPWYPEGWIEPEITWALVPGITGQGFATEAARCAIRAAFCEFGWTTAVSVISVNNAASVALAHRLGAIEERSIEYRYGAATLFRHPDPR